MREYVTKTPTKVLFLNTISGEEIEAQFNPTTFQEQIEANWAHLVVPGQSHETLHFTNTSNFKISLDLFFRATTTDDIERIHKARRHILSWVYPRNISNDIIGGGAPPLLLYWPHMLSLECVVTNVSINHEMFNSEGRSIQFTCNLQLEEIRNARLHYDDVADDNSLRLGSALGLEE